MGELWLVRHRELERVAALKEIKGGAVTHEDLTRFRREARALSNLHCPHTIQVYDFGIGQHGHPYYVMEYLDGVNLQDLVTKRGPFAAERAVHVLRQVCLSLDEAHEVGLVHRDIKPANIMLCHYATQWDFVKLLDFGLVKRDSNSESISLTRPAVVLGTPAYVAPESLRGSKFVDGRADLYAVGAVGYFLLTGRLLFDHDQPIAMAKAHLLEKAPRASEQVRLPAALDELLDECLAKDPDQRPQSAKQVLERLNAVRIEQWSQTQAQRLWDDYGPLLRKTSTS
jgi:serine/threonine-protein kinase